MLDRSNTVGFKMTRIVRHKRQLIDQHMKPLGLSRTQWQVMVWLGILGTPCQQKDLLNNIEIDAAHLARVLEKLERASYITRARISTNRRMVSIDVTAKGKKLFNKIDQIMTNENKTLLGNLSPADQKHFHKVLDQVENNLVSATSEVE